MPLRLLTFFILSILITFSAFGNGDFRHISTKEGLSSNRTYRAIQDKKGFIWITTDMGVGRFDGKGIVHYELERYEEISRYGYQFNHILIDENDNIFIVTNRNYVYRFNPDKDKFELINTFHDYFGKYVYDALITSDNKLLLGTPSSLLIYDYVTDSISKPGVRLTNIHTFIDFDDGYIFAEINSLIKTDKNFTTSKKLDNGMPEPNVFILKIVHDKKRNRLWIGTKNSGILYFDFNTNRYSEVNTNKYLKDFPVKEMTIMNDSTLLIGSDGAGLMMMDMNTNKLTARYQFDQDDDNSISSNVIHGILLTRDSLLFITTDIGGACIMNPHRSGFTPIKREKGNPNSLRNNVAYAIKEISPDNIVFGTDRGLSLWNRRTNRWTHPGKSTDNGKNNVVTQIAPAKDGTFWVNYFIGQTRVFNPSPKFRIVPPELKAVRNSKAMLFDDRTNTLWMGRNGRNVTLISYNFDNHTLNHFTLPYVLDLKKYKKRKILAGTINGLYIIDIFKNDFFREDNISNKVSRISSMAITNDDNLCIASYEGGIARADLNGGDITQYTMANGLPSNHFYSIETDRSGNIWAASDKGISRINSLNGKIVNFFTYDGAVTVDYLHHPICKLHTGEIIVGGTNGATLFDPQKVRVPDYSGNLVFTSLFVNQEKITPANSKILTSPLNSTGKIQLTFNENSFSIEFTNIDLVHPGQHKYTWKLEGFDTDWSKPVPDGIANYSNLAPGKYKFRARLISNILSGISPPERSIEITIKPPFWRTPLAFILYILIILFIILLALHYNKLMHDVRSTNERLQYLANMAHEIKTPLTLIRAPVEDLARETTDSNTKDKLKLALNNIEKLQKKISQFLDFKKIYRIENIYPEKIDIISFVKKKIYAFNLVAEKNNIKLTFESAAESQIIYCAPEILDRIISNLLSNAIKYNKPGGFINVRILVEEPNWKITVTDSGIGIPSKEINKILKPFYRASNAKNVNKPGSGVGLALVADMVKLLGGNIKIKSKVNKGTTFKLVFPVGQPDIHSIEDEPTLSDTGTLDIETEAATPDRLKVLIVEDDAELREYIRKELSDKYRVIEASDGDEALNIIKKELPDLVLSDVGMPGMNGRQLCISIKKEPSTSHIPVILLSGLDSKEHILKGLEAGADDYITKPFDSSILKVKIETLINNRQKVKDIILDPGRGIHEADISNKLDQEFVSKITSLIEENISDPELSVRMLYSSAGMSRTAFYHKLKSLIDMSPAEFIRLVRLNKAKELLLTNKYNINEVAYMSGFSDPKYFSTSFKKHFGKSPSAFVSGK